MHHLRYQLPYLPHQPPDDSSTADVNAIAETHLAVDDYCYLHRAGCCYLYDSAVMERCVAGSPSDYYLKDLLQIDYGCRLNYRDG